jgi:hypothetical protein
MYPYRGTDLTGEDPEEAMIITKTLREREVAALQRTGTISVQEPQHCDGILV